MLTLLESRQFTVPTLLTGILVAIFAMSVSANAITEREHGLLKETAYYDARPETKCFAAIYNLNASLYMTKNSPTGQRTENSKILDKKNVALVAIETMRALSDEAREKHADDSVKRSEYIRAEMKRRFPKIRYVVQLDSEQFSEDGKPLQGSAVAIHKYTIRDLTSDERVKFETHITLQDVREMNRKSCGKNRCDIDPKDGPFGNQYMDLYTLTQKKIGEKLAHAMPSCSGKMQVNAPTTSANPNTQSAGAGGQVR